MFVPFMVDVRFGTDAHEACVGQQLLLDSPLQASASPFAAQVLQTDAKGV